MLAVLVVIHTVQVAAVQGLLAVMLHNTLEETAEQALLMQSAVEANIMLVVVEAVTLIIQLAVLLDLLLLEVD
jgi:hypothetical protein